MYYATTKHGYAHENIENQQYTCMNYLFIKLPFSMKTFLFLSRFSNDKKSDFLTLLSFCCKDCTCHSVTKTIYWVGKYK